MKERAAYTPGPWTVGRRKQGAKHTYRVLGRTLHPSDTLICEWATMGPSPSTERDFARIVACVNALEGLDPEAVSEVVEAARKAADFVRVAQDDSDFCGTCGGFVPQRETMLLGPVKRKIGHKRGCLWVKLDAALAKLEGKS